MEDSCGAAEFAKSILQIIISLVWQLARTSESSASHTRKCVSVAENFQNSKAFGIQLSYRSVAVSAEDNANTIARVQHYVFLRASALRWRVWRESEGGGGGAGGREGGREG